MLKCRGGETMKKINVETTKLNNEDVIATSGVCAGQNSYHLYVNRVNVTHGETSNLESCYLYTTGDLDYTIPVFYDELPSDIKNSFADHLSSTYYVDLANAAEDDTYYWNGSSWTKCSVTHQYPD